MRHDVGVEWPNRKEETFHVDFVIYGRPKGYSAMAATVGYPTAIAAKMVLEGWLTPDESFFDAVSILWLLLRYVSDF
jgi:saccharopine dehydrogenase-like NADP-dependent oxidoreductase